VRIALRAVGPDDAWIGGTQYIENLVRSVNLADPSVASTLVFGNAEAAQGFDASRFQNVTTVCDATLPGSSFLAKAWWHTFGKSRLISGIGADATFNLGRVGRARSILWYPDFQDERMPEMFSEQERKARAAYLATDGAVADVLLLSSEAAMKDCSELHPELVSRVRVLPFSTLLPEGLRADLEALAPYGLERGRFFLLPNQWWKHKGHLIALEAFEKAGAPFPLVITGSPVERRFPAYPSEILQRIARSRFRDRILVLGLVPRAVLLQLIRHARAVLQPSFFEGWSTVLEDVRALGGRVIATDLPVHHEQAVPSALYYPPRDTDALAAHMRGLDEHSPLEDFAALVAASRERARAFGQRFLALALG
jgi:glycosyltransferase involved in cell wall biosynthesis